MKQKLIPYLLLSSALYISQNVVAATVYQWTDADGIVHFSDAPPADAAVTTTREILLDDFTENVSSPEKYSIIDQADIMAAWRQQLTEDRLAVKRMQLEERNLAQELELNRLQAEQQLDGYSESYPHYFVYPQPYFNNFHRRRDHEQPEEPVAPESPQPRFHFTPSAGPQAGESAQLRVNTEL